MTTVSAPRRSRRRTAALIVAAVLAAAAAAFAAVNAGTRESGPKPLVYRAHTLTGVGSCDVSGVHVSYLTEWVATSNEYIVSGATVDNIEQPTCEGAVLRVSLRNVNTSTQQTTVLATSNVELGNGTTQSLTFSPAPDANGVNDVQVELAGGETPVPDECKTMKLKTVVMGTTGDDIIDDTKGGNLVYGLTGADSISSGSVGDCIVVQGGNDTIVGGNGDDVVFVEGGANNVMGGPGGDLIKVGDGDSNTVHGGNGDDTIYIGSGTGNTVDGGNGKKNVCHIPYPPAELAAHGTVITNCKVVNP